MPFGVYYDVVATLARWSIYGFFREIRVIGYENVPKEGPIIACSTHNNMIVDPAILVSTFPHKRKIHFWAKNSLFGNKYFNVVLHSGGVVPVDRTSRNNKALFASTMEVLKLGEVVAVFPEGTSHSESRLIELKDGASWAALQCAAEYVSNYNKIDQGNNSKNNMPIQQVVILPCGITYLQKSKYRSSVIVTYGPPINVEALFLKDFLENERAAVKQLTKRIEVEMEKLSINAVDWDILNSASMTRKLMFSDDKRIHLEDHVKITQHLIHFLTNTTSEEVTLLKKSLNDYKVKLDALNLSNSDIARYDTRSLTIPWALYQFLFEFFRFLIQLPFFLPGLCFHWPIYVMGKISAKYEIYEESRAQNKIILGLAWLILSYTVLFFCVWSIFFGTPLGLILAAGSVFIFAWYHIALVDSHYDAFKNLSSSFILLLTLTSSKDNSNRDDVEELIRKRHSCIDQLKLIEQEYRVKSDDLRIVLKYRERDYYQHSNADDKKII